MSVQFAMWRRPTTPIGLSTLIGILLSCRTCFGGQDTRKEVPHRAPSAAASAPLPVVSHPNYKIVYWFDPRRPLDTFRHQEYDVRKGQFRPEVQRWVAETRKAFPSFDVYIRDVDLSQFRGNTEAHKIGAAVISEFTAVAASHGYDLSVAPSPRVNSRPMPLTTYDSTIVLPRAVAPPPSSPFPEPYPRPHP